MAKTTLKQASPAKVGQRVSWKAGGKVSRIEGVAGKVVWGSVTEVNKAEGRLSVMPDHRTLPGAMFTMGTCVEFAQVLAVANATRPARGAKTAKKHKTDFTMEAWAERIWAAVRRVGRKLTDPTLGFGDGEIIAPILANKIVSACQSTGHTVRVTGRGKNLLVRISPVGTRNVGLRMEICEDYYKDGRTVCASWFDLSFD